MTHLQTKRWDWPGCRKKTVPGKGRFCGIAASKRLDNHQGCLRRFSLRSHQNRPFPGAEQFCPRILDEESTKSGPSSLGGLRGRSACFMRQNPTAEPPFSYATLSFTQFFTASACISPAGWPPGWQGPPRPARSRSRRGCPRRERARSCPTGWTRWWAP